MPDLKPLPKPVDLKKPVNKLNKERIAKPLVPERERIAKPFVPERGRIAKPFASEEERITKPQRARRQQYYQPKRARHPIPQRRSAQVQANAKKAYRFLSKYNVMGIGAVALLVVTLIFLLMWSFAGNNTLAISIGDEHFAYIAFSQDFDAETIRNEAQGRVEAREGARVVLSEQISVLPAGGRGVDILPYHEAIEQLAAALPFQIIGTAIEINGNRTVVLRNLNEAEQVIWTLQAPFLGERNREDYYLIEFLEDLRLTDAIVEAGELYTVQQALSRLDRTATIMEEYTVQEGDTLGAIALRNGTSLTQIYEDNPGLSPATVLRPGDVISIRSQRPFLSVRTIEAVSREEIIPIENVYLDNPGLAVNTTQIAEEGREGLRVVVVHYERINGIQTGPAQEIAVNILEASRPNIIEVGAMQ